MKMVWIKYPLNRNYLVNEKRRYGSSNSRPYILPNKRVINIDNEMDFYMAEAILKNRKKNW